MSENKCSQYQVIVVGGSFAGLSAATSMARNRMKILVIDNGQNRNRTAHQAHGILGQSGGSPNDILKNAREHLKRYSEFVTLVSATVTKVSGSFPNFSVEIEANNTSTPNNISTFSCERVVLTTGMTDELPEEWIRQRWGNQVAHCSHCHSYFEVPEPRRIAWIFNPNLDPKIIGMSSKMVAEAFTGCERLALLDGNSVSPTLQGQLEGMGYKVVSERIKTVEGTSSMTINGKHNVEQIYYLPLSEMNLTMVDDMQFDMKDTPYGKQIAVDQFMMTSVKGVYAAGDIAAQPWQVITAMESGHKCGIFVHLSYLQ